MGAMGYKTKRVNTKTIFIVTFHGLPPPAMNDPSCDSDMLSIGSPLASAAAARLPPACIALWRGSSSTGDVFHGTMKPLCASAAAQYPSWSEPAGLPGWYEESYVLNLASSSAACETSCGANDL